jgi:hypothetical protein
MRSALFHYFPIESGVNREIPYPVSMGWEKGVGGK